MIGNHTARQQADVMGVINAGWADAGLHPEVFWLGYAAITAAGWNPTSANAQVIESFYAPLRPSAVKMERLYQLMSYQAQFWVDSWERVDSTARKPIFGYSRRINIPRQAAKDFALELPETPAPVTLGYAYPWSWANRRRLELAAQVRREYEELVTLLDENRQKVELNRYNLEVFHSIAGLYKENLDFLESLKRIDERFTAAYQTRAMSRRGRLLQSWIRRSMKRAKFANNAIWHFDRPNRPGTKPGNRAFYRPTAVSSSLNSTTSRTTNRTDRGLELSCLPSTLAAVRRVV